MSDIGNEIRQIRQSLGLTQGQFIALFNATKPKEITIGDKPIFSKYETGRVVPKADVFEKIRSMKRK